MLAWRRRANPDILVSKNAGWVCGAGWVFQRGLPWPELGAPSGSSVQTLVPKEGRGSRGDSLAPRHRQRTQPAPLTEL